MVDSRSGGKEEQKYTMVINSKAASEPGKEEEVWGGFTYMMDGLYQ